MSNVYTKYNEVFLLLAIDAELSLLFFMVTFHSVITTSGVILQLKCACHSRPKQLANDYD